MRKRSARRRGGRRCWCWAATSSTSAGPRCPAWTTPSQAAFHWLQRLGGRAPPLPHPLPAGQPRLLPALSRLSASERGPDSELCLAPVLSAAGAERLPPRRRGGEEDTRRMSGCWSTARTGSTGLWRGKLSRRAYEMVHRAQLHRPLAYLLHRKRRVARRVLAYLENAGEGPETGVRQVFFGHIHRRMFNYRYRGVTFHNCGAPIEGMRFRILECSYDGSEPVHDGQQAAAEYLRSPR